MDRSQQILLENIVSPRYLKKHLIMESYCAHYNRMPRLMLNNFPM